MEILLQNLNEYGRLITCGSVDNKKFYLFENDETIFTGTHYEVMTFVSGMIYMAETSERSSHGKMRLAPAQCACGGLKIIS